MTWYDPLSSWLFQVRNPLSRINQQPKALRHDTSGILTKSLQRLDPPVEVRAVQISGLGKWKVFFCGSPNFLCSLHVWAVHLSIWVVDCGRFWIYETIELVCLKKLLLKTQCFETAHSRKDWQSSKSNSKLRSWVVSFWHFATDASICSKIIECISDLLETSADWSTPSLPSLPLRTLQLAASPFVPTCGRKKRTFGTETCEEMLT